MKTLIEHWNGSRWAIMSSPSPDAFAGGWINLNAVSCPSTTSCVAVGVSGREPFGPSGHSLVERWNGSHWSVMSSRNPPGSMYAMLAGVACPSTTSCFAIGDSGKPLVEHWNGRGGWSIMTGIPNPGHFAFLLGVSCPSTTSCFATGFTGGPALHKSLVEHWDGRGSWSIITNPVSDPNADLVGVSCPSTTNCFAIGDDVTASVAHWNGHRWSLTTVLRPPTFPHIPHLLGLTCPSTNSCFAIGATQHKKALVFRYA